VLEAAVRRHAIVQGVLARMAERRVARSCASAMASTRSSFRRSARAIERPNWATSSECVRRVSKQVAFVVQETCVL